MTIYEVIALAFLLTLLFCALGILLYTEYKQYKKGIQIRDEWLQVLKSLNRALDDFNNSTD